MIKVIYIIFVVVIKVFKLYSNNKYLPVKKKTFHLRHLLKKAK